MLLLTLHGLASGNGILQGWNRMIRSQDSAHFLAGKAKMRTVTKHDNAGSRNAHRIDWLTGKETPSADVSTFYLQGNVRETHKQKLY